MKKIIFITNTLSIGGADKVCTNLENMFYKSGYDTLTLSIQDYGKNYKILGKHAFIGIKSKKVFPLKSYFNIIKCYLKFKKILKNFNPDVIISNAYNPSLINLLASKYGKQTRILIHHENTTSFKNNFHGFGKITYILFNKLVFLLIKTDDTIVCVSNHSAHDLRNNFKIKGKIEVIHNGIDTKKINELSKEKVNLDFPYIINIGTLEKRKNQIMLIKAYEKIYKDINEHFVFVGSGPNENILKNYVKEKGLESKVHFLGFQSNPYKYLKNANLMVHTAFAESMSLSMLESISLGIPTITTKNGSEEEIVGNSNCAVILESFDYNELAEKIIFVLNNEKIKNNLKEKGIKRSRNFSVEKQFEEYKKLMI